MIATYTAAFTCSFTINSCLNFNNLIQVNSYQFMNFFDQLCQEIKLKLTNIYKYWVNL